MSPEGEQPEDFVARENEAVKRLNDAIDHYDSVQNEPRQDRMLHFEKANKEVKDAAHDLSVARLKSDTYGETHMGELHEQAIEEARKAVEEQSGDAPTAQNIEPDEQT